jgi:hypothetical protein
MTIKNYDPKKIAVIMNGQPVTGFADGTFVKVEMNEDAFMLVVGADGETTRVKNANQSGKITITLLGSSASNDALSALAVTDRLTGTGTFTALVKDARGTSLHAAATAWVEKMPSSEFAKESPGHREWVIATDELIMFAGGVGQS